MIDSDHCGDPVNHDGVDCTAAKNESYTMMIMLVLMLMLLMMMVTTTTVTLMLIQDR